MEKLHSVIVMTNGLQFCEKQSQKIRRKKLKKNLKNRNFEKKTPKILPCKYAKLKSPLKRLRMLNKIKSFL